MLLKSNEGFESNINKDKILGTENYIAPEVIKGEECGQEVDYWALGVMLYELYTNDLPFNAPTPTQIFNNIITLNVKWEPFERKVNVTTIDFVKKLLTLDPKERLGSNGVDEIKNHPYFKGKESCFLMFFRF